MRLVFIIVISSLSLYGFSQELIQSYFHTNSQSMIPKEVISFKGQTVMPYSLLGNATRSPGIAFFENNTLINSIVFEGENEYVINQLIESQDSTLLLSAEGYSDDGQESLYFLEIDDEEIVNEFIYNENGNELDPFAMVENGENIFVAGFLKERELISNSFFNMYSERQDIYFSEFSKSGTKIWSKSLEIEGYNLGICNAMKKIDNHLILLCHATNSDNKLSTFLIKIDFEGKVILMKEFFLPDSNLSSNLILINQGKIDLIGSFQRNRVHHVFKMNLDLNLNVISQSEFITNNSINIYGSYNNLIFGGIISDNEGYNYALLQFNDNKAQLLHFGGIKSEIIIGASDNYLYGYSIASSSEKTASLNLFNYDNSLISYSELNKSSNKILNSFNSNYTTNSEFTKSKINKGIKRMSVRNNFRQIKEIKF